VHHAACIYGCGSSPRARVMKEQTLSRLMDFSVSAQHSKNLYRSDTNKIKCRFLSGVAIRNVSWQREEVK